LAVDGWGIGGPVRSDVVSAAEVKLGSVAVRGVITGLATQDSGTFADPAYHGNVGSKLLKRFVVTFDYSRRHMYLEPRSDLVDDTGTFDRAGMWINAATDGFEIIEVTACGPAALAGLKAGDRIVSVDGQPADGHALPALRRRLRNDPVGDMITFSIRFSGETRSVTITLKDQV
jgi:predicted metalloprotease with PDZ domain